MDTSARGWRPESRPFRVTAAAHSLRKGTGARGPEVVTLPGELAERSKAVVLKTTVGATLPGVRIPRSPPR